MKKIILRQQCCIYCGKYFKERKKGKGDHVIPQALGMCFEIEFPLGNSSEIVSNGYLML